MSCLGCKHQDTRTYAVPVCTHPEALRPHACVLVYERCPDKERKRR